MSQMEMQFTFDNKHTTKKANDNGEKPNPSRPHNRTTILTTTRATYELVRALKPGEKMPIFAVNDVVSSAKGGQSIDHHMLRRFSLVSRQFRGSYYKIKVRSDAGNAIECRMVSAPRGQEDDCQFSIWIAKPEQAA